MVIKRGASLNEHVGEDLDTNNPGPGQYFRREELKLANQSLECSIKFYWS